MKCTDCSMEVRPVVALDIDGTLGRYHEHLIDFLEMYFGRNFSHGWGGSGNWEDYLGLTSDEYREAKLAFRQGGQKRSMPAFSGAQLLSETAAKHAEVWITTTRPYLRLDSVDPDTREWLRRNNISYDHLLYDDNKYSRLAQLVDPERVIMVLDDLPDQYDEARFNFGHDAAVLAERSHNTDYRETHKHIITTRTLHEASACLATRATRWKGRYAPDA